MTNCIIVCGFLFIIFLISITISLRYILFFKYKDVISSFELFLSKSYDMIYQNSLISYFSSGVKDIPYDEKESIERDFIKQTLILMGKNNEEIIYKYFGKQEFAINYMVTYIRKRIADDGLSQIIKDADIK